jgi:hypothetical protein
MTKRERQLQVQQVLQKAFAGIDPNDAAARAEAVRNLCPCRGEPWSVSLWEFIFAACQDPSSDVRMEALHVIEDSTSQSVPNAHGRRFLLQATKDPDAEVRRFAEEVVVRNLNGGSKKGLKKLKAKRRLKKKKRPSRQPLRLLASH